MLANQRNDGEFIKMTNRHEFKNSSSIKSCDYDDGEKRMTIEFTSGAVYHYPNCDKAHYEALKAAASVGKHFHQNCRKLECKKVS